MNGFERINMVLKGQKPDKVPIMLHNFLMAAHEYGVNMSQYRENPQVIANVYIDAIEKYNYDGIVVDVDTCTLAGAVGVPVDFPEDEPARVKGFKLDNLEDVINLKPIDISRDKRVNIWLESCQILSEKLGGQVFIRGNCDQAPFSLASMIRGVQNWMMDIYFPENEYLVFKLLEFCTDITEQFVKLMAQTGVHMVSNGDSVAGSEIISPSMYKKYAFSFEKKIVKVAHENNLPYALHICGCVNSILDLMIKTGADVLELDYKTDINLIHKKCSDKIIFCGNIDPCGVLALGDINDVKDKTFELLNIYSDSYKFILNSGCVIPSSTPSENLKMMISTTRKFVK